MVIVSKAVPDGTVTCSCFIDDEIVAEEVDNLPPSAAIVSIEIPNFAIRRSVDGSEFVVYEVRVGHADGEAAEAHVLHKRFADFDHLHALLRSVHGTGTCRTSRRSGARLIALPSAATLFLTATGRCPAFSSSSSSIWNETTSAALRASIAAISLSSTGIPLMA